MRRRRLLAEKAWALLLDERTLRDIKTGDILEGDHGAIHGTVGLATSVIEALLDAHVAKPMPASWARVWRL